MSGRAAKIIGLLEGVANGSIEARTAIDENWREFEEEPDKIVTSAFHEQHHFAADADIRERDTEYARVQRETLLNLARKIRESYSL